jgi:hypothetical protein
MFVRAWPSSLTTMILAAAKVVDADHRHKNTGPAWAWA